MKKLNWDGGLPKNLEAERQVLGAILINNDAYRNVAAFLKPDHFFDPANARLYAMMAEMINRNRLATPITLKPRVTTWQEGTSCAEAGTDGVDDGLFAYMTHLVAEAATILHVGDYGKQVRDMAVRRSMITVGQNAIARARDTASTTSPVDHVEAIERELFSVVEPDAGGGGFIGFDESVTRSVERVTSAYTRDGKVCGVATGFRALDRRIGGLNKSDLVVVAARPGMGKTAFATNIAFHAARKWSGKRGADGALVTHTGAVVGFFSLEMSAEQLATRIVAEQTRISSSDLRRGDIDAEQFARLADVSREMVHLPLAIDETGGLDVGTLVTRARRQKRRHGLDVVIVDYLQLLHSARRGGVENRVQEVAQITSALKSLAKELNVPVVAISQLSRRVESRDDKRPQLSDLRDSGSIEQDADIVLFIYRKEYYLEASKPQEGSPAHDEWLAEMAACRGLADLIIAKHRHGPGGVVKLSFDAALTRFSDLDTVHGSSDAG